MPIDGVSTDLAYAIAGALIIGIALYTFIVERHLVRRLIAFNVMGSGTFLVLVGHAQHERGFDPVPQALVLTGIVVAVASTALALLIIRRWSGATGSTHLPEDDRRDDVRDSA
jgi:multicomponent Na+:H+ antiporter subunit C